MSTNIYATLRRLLPPEPVLIGLVTAHDAATDTSTIELPAGPGAVPVTDEVTSGNVIQARGRTVAIGKNALVRGGVVESEAPDGTPEEIVVGSVVADPLGPQGIVFSGTVPAQAAAVGATFSLDLSGYFSGYYPALTFTLVAGSLTGSGLALNAATGVIAGTPTGAGALAGLVVRCTDATGLYAQTGAFTITVT